MPVGRSRSCAGSPCLTPTAILGLLRSDAESLRQSLARSFVTLDPAGRSLALPHLHQLSFEAAAGGQFERAAELAKQVAREFPADPSGRRSCALFRAALLYHQAEMQVASLDLAWEALGENPFQGGPHLKCVVDTPVPREGGAFPCMPMKGDEEHLRTLQRWLLEMSAGILGSDHPTTNARREVVRATFRRHGVPLPDEPHFRNPWRAPALGGFPVP